AIRQPLKTNPPDGIERSREALGDREAGAGFHVVRLRLFERILNVAPRLDADAGRAERRNRHVRPHRHPLKGGDAGVERLKVAEADGGRAAEVSVEADAGLGTGAVRVAVERELEAIP